MITYARFHHAQLWKDWPLPTFTQSPSNTCMSLYACAIVIVSVYNTCLCVLRVYRSPAVLIPPRLTWRNLVGRHGRAVNRTAELVSQIISNYHTATLNWFTLTLSLTAVMSHSLRASFSFLTDRLTGELTGRSTVDAFLELLTNGQMPVNCNCQISDR